MNPKLEGSETPQLSCETSRSPTPLPPSARWHARATHGAMLRSITSQIRPPAVVSVFSGQGSQFVGMGRDLSREWRVARDVFEAVDAGLKRPLSALMCGDQGDADTLKLTENAQPAMFAHSMAVWAVLQAELGLEAADCAVMMGHSLGEYTALTAAGAMDLQRAVELVSVRARVMQEAVPAGVGAMTAYFPLDVDTATSLTAVAAANTALECCIANVNSPSQVVVSGARAAVDEMTRLVRTLKQRVRCRSLDVSAPFHSPLLAAAVPQLEAFLSTTAFTVPQCAVVANVSADLVTATADDQCVSVEEAVRRLLVQQLTAPVLWQASVERVCRLLAAREGVLCLELGPRPILAPLVRETVKNWAAKADTEGTQPVWDICSLSSAQDVAAFLKRAEALL